MKSNSPYKETTRASYDNTVEAYHENVLKITSEAKALRFLKLLPKGSKLLDVGCGTGIDAAYFMQQGYAVTGIDISAKMLEIARRQAPQATFVQMDIEDISFPEASFDGVWASASLLHVPRVKLPAVLQSIHSCLRSGGIFYVAMKKGNGEALKADKRYGGAAKFWSYILEEELASLLENAHFEVLEIDTKEKSTAYQTHPWISVICQKK